MSLANAVFQLLVHFLPLSNLYRELGDMKRHLGAGGPETGGSATPLMDAMVRFFKEFAIKKKEPLSTQQPLQYIAEGKPSEDEQTKEGHNTVDLLKPRYMYDAMKEKGRLKNLLVGFRD